MKLEQDWRFPIEPGDRLIVTIRRKSDNDPDLPSNLVNVNVIVANNNPDRKVVSVIYDGKTHHVGWNDIKRFQ